MTTPEKSIDEIVKELKRIHPCIVTDKMAIGNQSELYIDVFNSFTQTLQTERQKRDEMVEKMKNRWRNSVIENITHYEKAGIVDYRGLEADIFAEAGKFNRINSQK